MRSKASISSSRDHAVGLRHFRRKRDDRDGEGDARIAVINRLFVAIE